MIFKNKIKDVCFLKSKFAVGFLQVKQKAAGLVEMMAFLRKRVEDDEHVQREIEKVFHELLL